MSTSNSNDEIRVGDKIIKIEEPDGWKFLEATRLIGEITEAVPDLLDRNAKFIADYQARNADHITREEARIRYPEHEIAGYADEWWAERGNTLVLRGREPSQQEQVMALFNELYKVARDRVVRLLAVLSAPSGELAKADLEGNLEDYLHQWEVTLLHGVKISRLVLLLWRTVKAMQAEFSADGEASAVVGEIREFFQPATRAAPDTPTPNEPPTSSTAPNEIEPELPPSDASSREAPRPTDGEPTKPSSSYDSERPSDGTDRTPSMAQAGASSESSPASSGSSS